MRLALSILILSCLIGCGGPIAGQAPESPTPGGTLSPNEIGLEAWVWRIDAVGGPLRSAITPHTLDANAGSDAQSRRWRRAGFRVVEIPASLAESVEPGLPHADALRHLWLGQPTQWTRLAMAAVHDVTAIDTSTGHRDPGSGRVELLTRSWIEPEANAGRVFRIEIAVGWTPQHSEGRFRREILDGLFLSRSIARGRALLLVPAPPDEDWTNPVTPPERTPDVEVGPMDSIEIHTPDPGIAPLPAPGASQQDHDTGPTPPSGRSIGEFLLMTPAVLGESPLPARREVFVLIPRWP